MGQTNLNPNSTLNQAQVNQRKELVSYLIAAYNEEQFIKECIDSCLNQTYPHIEVCVTDDGSRDQTWNVLQKEYKDHPRVVMERFEHNKGKIFAFNSSYEKASGQYFALIGADDVSFKNRIESSYNFLKENQCDLIFAKRFFCDENLLPLKIADSIITPSNIKIERLLFNNFCHGTTLFFNRRIAQKCFPIPDVLLFEDWWLGFISLMYGRVGYLRKPVTKYRQHSRNDLSNIEPADFIKKKKKDFLRHFNYYSCFQEEIQKNQNLNNKKKYLKLIKLNTCYRKAFLEDNFLTRLKHLPSVIRYAALDLVFFLSIPIIFFGNRIFKFKQTGFIRYFVSLKEKSL
jgi:glycosyltransferase involved in cell wall biosynthesis